ncbi:uncharacterized protein PG998_003802 [Apiospora kogelbergensis]|uniref:uncharacterized protein n=1 Tax=Apiospora kogelbergensis TaxID=1337665 RepID=UPI00312F202D
MATAARNFLSLPQDILMQLPDYLHTIEDLVSVGATCRSLRRAMDTALPRTILRLAASQTRTFFRPSPHYLVMATARELGEWARQSTAHEQQFGLRMREGLDGLLDLALHEARCGLTLARIRELHELRSSVMNPVTDIIDKCVGAQWYNIPDFWDGGADDAYTIQAEPSETLFHLAIYGELFGPDLDVFLDPGNLQYKDHRLLSVDSRLDYVKYGLPDFACHLSGQFDPAKTRITAPPDPRRMVCATGPYKNNEYHGPNHNLALTWTINSSRFRPHLTAMRTDVAHCADFQQNYDQGWWYDEVEFAHNESGSTGDAEYKSTWRQRLWENVMVCQGLEGLQMLLPGATRRERWAEKVREWRLLIENLGREPALVKVGRQATLASPYLLGDLRVCVSGYVGGS